jgi:hypothetical protein
MRDRRQRPLAAVVVPTWHAPIVCMQKVWRRWPLSDRQRTLNAAAYCATVSTVSPGQHRNGQVAGARDTVYGSEGWATEQPGAE